MESGSFAPADWYYRDQPSHPRAPFFTIEIAVGRGSSTLCIPDPFNSPTRGIQVEVNISTKLTTEL